MVFTSDVPGLYLKIENLLGHHKTAEKNKKTKKTKKQKTKKQKEDD
jgi:hypothetical protein